MSWYDKSFLIIQEQRKEVADLDLKEQRKYCSREYPFRERRGWAYKAWLRAMNDHFNGKKPKFRAQKPKEIDENQLDLLTEIGE